MDLGRELGVPALSVRSLNNNRVDGDGLVRVAPVTRSLTKYRVCPRDVIVSARSTNFGVAIVPEGLGGVVITSTLIGIRCGGRLNPRLLAAYLRHPVGRAAIDELNQSGTAQMNITVRAMASLRVPVPPREDQDRIARLLEAAEAAYDAAIHAAERRYDIAKEVVFRAMSGATI